MLSVYPVLDILVFRVDVVDNDICVPLMTGSKHNHFEVLVNQFQHLPRVWPDVESRLQDFSRHERDIKIHIRFPQRILLPHTMCQCFIQVEYDCLLNVWLREGQVYHSAFYLFIVNGCQVLQEVDRLEYVDREFPKHWSLQL